MRRREWPAGYGAAFRPRTLGCGTRDSRKWEGEDGARGMGSGAQSPSLAPLSVSTSVSLATWSQSLSIYLAGVCDSQMTCELISRGSDGDINVRCYYSVRSVLTGAMYSHLRV